MKTTSKQNLIAAALVGVLVFNTDCAKHGNKTGDISGPSNQRWC